jgi:hypothetical protein
VPAEPQASRVVCGHSQWCKLSSLLAVATCGAVEVCYIGGHLKVFPEPSNIPTSASHLDQCRVDDAW